MTGPKLIDEINRLFDQMVRDPWTRPARPPTAAMGPGGRTQLDAELPIDGGQLSDISVALEGRRLVVRARRSTSSTRAGTQVAREEIERTFVLPEDADVCGIEARVEEGILHVRVTLRPERK